MRRPIRLEQRIVERMSVQLSIRQAARMIVVATAFVVVLSGVLMWAVDHSEYPGPLRGMWWALQTVTTVGYGDVTPHTVAGRIVASLVMLWAIAFVTVLVAAVTSSFIAGIQRQLAREEAEEEAAEERRLDARFDELAERLDRLEQLLTRRN